MELLYECYLQPVMQKYRRFISMHSIDRQEMLQIYTFANKSVKKWQFYANFI